MIDTGKVTDRRQLHFNSPEEVLADVERLVAADRAGTLRRTGNWTLGQTLGHMATWIEFAYDGYPSNLKAPWLIKVMLRLAKKRFLQGPLPTGKRIPGLEEGTLGHEACSTEEGTARYTRAWERLRKAAPPVPNPIFGPLPHEDWKRLHMRHAELHLGFMHAS